MLKSSISRIEFGGEGSSVTALGSLQFGTSNSPERIMSIRRLLDSELPFGGIASSIENRDDYDMIMLN